MGRINRLPPLLSSRIAAGEVIERPQSVLRELLDNAIDAGSDDIRVNVDGGGIDRISVADNGEGIAREDLSEIAMRHATSKIHDPDDLYTINTLGFRGEALYSISAVSKLTISTTERATGEKGTLVIDNGRRYEVEDRGPVEGTVCTSEDLFLQIPARRSFLKRNATETQLCRSLLISKALAFPSISFTLRCDGETKMLWKKAETLKERVMMLYREYSIPEADVTELKADGDGYTVEIVAANQAWHRSDRKEIRIYVNGRPVEEYSMVQALCHGFGELLPGGSFPYASVFINDSPEMVDFNIHPAKKEVKIRNRNEIHHSISTMVRNGIERRIPKMDVVDEFYLDGARRSENGERKTSYGIRTAPSPSPVLPRKETEYDFSPSSSSHGKSVLSERIEIRKPRDREWLEKAEAFRQRREEISKDREEIKSQFAEKEERGDTCVRYIGQAFSLFLVCERGDTLYLVDQHAAHERILYDELVAGTTMQRLLIPIEIEVDDSTDEFLLSHSHVYTSLSISLSRKTKGVWEIDALPAIGRNVETEIVDFITSSRLDEKELEEKIFAIMACRAAVKQGDIVDRWAAEAILEKVFAMKEPCCPHGRTFLTRITKDRLKELVGRTK